VSIHYQYRPIKQNGVIRFEKLLTAVQYVICEMLWYKCKQG